MKAVQVLRYGSSLKCLNYEVPRVDSGQALIKVLHAPIHPADVYYWKGIYGIKKPVPSPIGFEGVGVVESSPIASQLGQLAAFLPTGPFGCIIPCIVGSWSQYCQAEMSDIMILKQGSHAVPNSSCALINPFTALGFLDIVDKGRFGNVLFSSSASAVSRMSIRMLEKLRPDVVVHSLPRGEDVEQGVELLDNKFQGPVAFFDSLGGPMSGKILRRLPPKSKLISYGSSSMTHIGWVDPQDLIFRNKTIQGFWMHQYYYSLSKEQREAAFGLIRDELTETGIFHTSIEAHFSLERIADALKLHSEVKGKGKIILDM